MKEDPSGWCGNAPTTFGDVAVRYVFHYGHTEAALEFITFLKLTENVIGAGLAGKFNFVEAALNTRKVEINKITNGKTLRYLAAYPRDLPLFQKLLSLAADIKMKCNNIFNIGSYDQLQSKILYAFAQNCNDYPDGEYEANRGKAREILRFNSLTWKMT
ncbi:MAG: hypothetical protein Q9175_007478, partial [Cornicularia normoerica]